GAPRLLNPLSLQSHARAHRDQLSFPTRRSSDLDAIWIDRPFDRKILEEIVSIAVDVLTSTAKTIRINREDKPAQIVKGIYRKIRSEEHTSGLQSRFDLVCRLLLETTN